MLRAPIRRTRGGDYKVDLDQSTRDLIARVCDELDALLDTDSPALARLFPPPYGDDEERNQGYAVLAGPELIESRRASLSVVRSSIGATRLDEGQLVAWMRSLNDVRLVLGTLLGIEEDHVRPVVAEENAATFALYEYLGGLIEVIVSALGD